MMRPAVYRIPFQKMRRLLSMLRLMYPIAVMLVASGQGLTAVNSPSTKAVTIGISLLSSMFCKKSIVWFYFKSWLILFFSPVRKACALLRAFSKPKEVISFRFSLPFFHWLTYKEDHVTRYLSGIFSPSGVEMSISLNLT